MIILFDQIPMPLSENQAYATDWKTQRRFETKELKEYKTRVQAWSLRRFKEIAALNAQLKWDLADHRKMLRLDSYFFFQYEELFTKPTTQNERPRRKRMDVSNRVKPLHDAISNLLQVDDSRFFPGVAEPFLRVDGPGMYVAVKLSLTMIEEEAEGLPRIREGVEKIY